MPRVTFILFYTFFTLFPLRKPIDFITDQLRKNNRFVVKRQQICGDTTTNLWLKDNRFVVAFFKIKQFLQKPIVVNYENQKNHT
ncbi:MAG: hypothetical protein D3913_05590 [Candidatus Electrothrix sp. LOE1_4_5]|nr:hypothetical protein [Candidatus Electrothrix gigas]